MKIDEKAKNELADFKSHKKLPQSKSPIIGAGEKITPVQSRNE
jgi:hypothetical protein